MRIIFKYGVWGGNIELSVHLLVHDRKSKLQRTCSGFIYYSERN